MMKGKSALVSMLVFVSFLSFVSASYSYANSAYWHCDIGGSWGWKTADIQNCPAGYVNFYDSSQGCSSSFTDVCLKYTSFGNGGCTVGNPDECCYQSCRKSVCDDASWSSCSNTCGSGTQTSNCGNTRSCSDSSGCTCSQCGTYPSCYSKSTYYSDADGDGYYSSKIDSCVSPGIGWTTAIKLSGDCVDTNVSIRPGAIEVCNGVDDNCNGQIDEGLSCGNNVSNQTNTPNVTIGTVPNVMIVSPIAYRSYNQNIVLNATSDQFVNWTYSINGTNISFTPGLILVNLSYGFHTVFVYGSNSNGTGFAISNFFMNYSFVRNQTNPQNNTNSTCGNQTNVTNSLPAITINSPLNGFTYNRSLIAWNVIANQNISNWYYANSSGGVLILFHVNDSLNLSEGRYSFIVFGTNQNGVGNATTVFYVNFSYSGQANNTNQTNTTANNSTSNSDENDDSTYSHSTSSSNYETVVDTASISSSSELGNNGTIYLGGYNSSLENFSQNSTSFNILDFVWIMFLVFLILAILILVILILKHS